jgi:hypothetical protein
MILATFFGQSWWAAILATKKESLHYPACPA